jgi:chromosome segregation ATPase
MRLDLEEAEAEIEALEENLRVVMTQLHRLSDERTLQENSLQDALMGMQQRLAMATQRWDYERRSLEQEVSEARTAKEDLTRMVEEKETKLIRLGRELEELQSVRLSREMERVLADFNETRTREHLESLHSWSKHDLVSHCSLLTVNGRRQEA